MINELLLTMELLYFSGEKYKPFLVDNTYIGKENIIMASYDFDRNGKPDIYAAFKVTKRLSNDLFITNEYASAVFIDKNEDGNAEKILMDKDGDGSLETLLLPKKNDMKSI